MHINSMPDLVLRTIFAKLELPDLLNIGSVCHLWSWYKEQIGLTVRSLSLTIETNEDEQRRGSEFVIQDMDKLVNEEGKRMYPPKEAYPSLRYGLEMFGFLLIF